MSRNNVTDHTYGAVAIIQGISCIGVKGENSDKSSSNTNPHLVSPMDSSKKLPIYEMYLLSIMWVCKYIPPAHLLLYLILQFLIELRITNADLCKVKNKTEMRLC